MAGTRERRRGRVHFAGWCKHYEKLIYYQDLKKKDCRTCTHGKPCQHWVDHNGKEGTAEKVCVEAM